MSFNSIKRLTTAVAMFVLLQAVDRIYGSGETENRTGSEDTPTSVSPPRLPTEVTVGAYLIGLSRVSAPSEAFPNFEVEMFIDLSWHDPRLSFLSEEPMVFLEEEAEEKLSEIWSPDMEIENENRATLNRQR